MMAAAEHIFNLSRTGEDGVPLRSKLEHIARTTGKRPAALNGPSIPRPLVYLWNWFQDLNRARSYNGFGPDPITYPDFQAWAALTESRPRPREIALLKDLDLLWLRIQGERSE